MKLYTTLEQQLKKEPNYVTDNGELKKWVVLNKAQNFDEVLIGLLLDNEDLKEKFFVNVKGTLVFNQNLFVQFLEQKNYLNDSYTQYKNKVGLTIDGKYLKQRNEVALVWPFKDCILEGGQSREEDKREEIFFNEILAQDEITQLLEPKVLTNAKRIDKDGEKPLDQFNRNENGTITDNLIIKGNNLLALHTLKEEFAGKIKLIYIDPPYNTGGSGDTFAYNNSFKRSSWLTFMRNRLEVAKRLMQDNGVLIAAIDDYEMHTLRFLLDEILGDENRLGTVVVVHNPRGRNDDKYFATMHEYLLVYAKNKELVKLKNFEFTAEDLKQFNKEDDISTYSETPFTRTGNNSNKHERPNLFYSIYYDPKTNSLSLQPSANSVEILPINAEGEEKTWRWGKETFEQKKDTELLVKKVKGEFKVFKKRRPDDIQGRKPRTVWSDSRYDASSNGIMLLRSVLGKNEFSYPKSLYAVMDIIKVLSDKNDRILDFFAGSGTTAHAVLELNREDGGNRQFIMCEQMNYVETVTSKRIQKIIEQNKTNNFVYAELKKYNQNFIEQIEEAKDTKALLQIWEQMKAKSFLNYNVDIKKQDEHLEDFKALSLAEQKQHLCELLDKNQLYVNLSSLNDTDFACTEEEEKVNKDFYQIKK
ncbi:site-specific DNA-methyltransferase [Epilithonimonas sp.]|uniref:site-specific DNA-methyltransferase n=1 Tax=Epilithonimonas sp. TaxID=2894511 RepID=UPI0028AAEF13|nr:site-specific DNA-methyltransferase [Epilithonimonas sp.]